MTYPPPGGTPDPYQPQQPYGQQPSYDPTSPYSQDPYAAPASGAPSSGQPYGQPPASGQPYGQQSPYGVPSSGQPYGQQYAQPGYGQPYAQPGHGQMPAPTNTMAILSLVFAFVFPLAGIFMGHIAKKQIRSSGEAGEGLATAGLWLSYIFVIIGLIFCAFYVVVVIFAIGNSTTTTY